MIELALALIIGAIIGGVVMVFVYRNNEKDISPIIDKIDSLSDKLEAKVKLLEAEIKRLNEELKDRRTL